MIKNNFKFYVKIMLLEEIFSLDCEILLHSNVINGAIRYKF